MSINTNIKRVDGVIGGGGGVDFTEPVGDNLIIDVDDVNALLIRKDGDLGDVFNIDTIAERMTYKDSNEGLGKILTSDALGVATWQANSSLTLEDGTISDPSLKFANDTTLGFHRPATGELNFVKAGVPALTVDTGAVIVNSNLCAQALDISNITFTPLTGLGTTLGAYEFNTGLADTVGEDSINNFDLPTPDDMISANFTASYFGRSNVFNCSTSQGRCSAFTTEASKIAQVQGANSFFVSLWLNNPAWDSMPANFRCQLFFMTDANGQLVQPQYDDGFLLWFDSNTRELLFDTRQTVGTNTSNLLKTFVAGDNDAWFHIALSVDSVNGMRWWLDNVEQTADPTLTRPPSFFPIGTVGMGGGIGGVIRRGQWLAGCRLDDVVWGLNELDASKVNNLFTDTYSLGGLPSLTQQSRLRYDPGDGKTKFELLPSGDDIFTANGTELEIIKPLKYTGATPTNGHVLTSDASGTATWQTPPSASQVSLIDGTNVVPSLNFLNDTDMGIHRAPTGEFNFVKGAVPVLTLNSGMAMVNSAICARSHDIGDVTYNDSSGLGTVLAVYDYDADLTTSLTGVFNMETILNLDVSRLVTPIGGRTNVLRVNGGTTTRGIYTEDSTDIASIQGLTDFYVSIWFWPAGGGSNARMWSFHNGTDLGTATDYIAFNHSASSGFIQIKKGGSIVFTSSSFSISPTTSWHHIVVGFSTTNGIDVYIDNVLTINEPTELNSLSTIPITRFVLGGDDSHWVNTGATSAYVDTVVLVGGALTVGIVDDLFNDIISFSGLPTFTQQSRLRYDPGDGKTKLELLPSGDDIFTANGTELEIIKPLKYTGATPTNGHYLKTDAVGTANWSNLNLQSYTFGTLPAGTIGDIAYITDGNTVSYRVLASGGGSDIVLVFFDGTNWIYH